MREITVCTIKKTRKRYGRRSFIFYLQYTHPYEKTASGKPKKITKATNATNRADAEILAKEWADELNGRKPARSMMLWSELREKFEREEVATKAEGTRNTYKTDWITLRILRMFDGRPKLTGR